MILVRGNSKLIFDLKNEGKPDVIKFISRTNLIGGSKMSCIFEQWAVNNQQSVYTVGSKRI